MKLIHTDSFQIIRENYDHHGPRHNNNKVGGNEEEKEESQIGFQTNQKDVSRNLDKDFCRSPGIPEDDYWFENEEEQDGYKWNEEGETELVKMDLDPITSTRDEITFTFDLDSNKSIQNEKKERYSNCKANGEIKINDDADCKNISASTIGQQGKEKKIKISTIALNGVSIAYAAFRNFFRASELSPEEKLRLRAKNIGIGVKRTMDELGEDTIKYLQRNQPLKINDLNGHHVSEKEGMNTWNNEFRSDSDSDICSYPSSTELDSYLYSDPYIVFFKQTIEVSFHEDTYIDEDTKKNDDENKSKANVPIEENDPQYTMKMQKGIDDGNQLFKSLLDCHFPYRNVSFSVSHKSILKDEKQGRYSQELADRLSAFIEEHLAQVKSLAKPKVGAEQIDNTRKNDEEKRNVLTMEKTDKKHEKESPSNELATNDSSPISRFMISAPSRCLCCRFQKFNLELLFNDGESFFHIGNGLGEHEAVKSILCTSDFKFSFPYANQKNQSELKTLSCDNIRNDLEKKSGPFLCIGSDIDLHYPLCTICYEKQSSLLYSPKKKQNETSFKGIKPETSLKKRNLEAPSFKNIQRIDTYTTRKLESKNIGRLEGELLHQTCNRRQDHCDSTVNMKRILFADELPEESRTSLHQEYVSSTLQYSFSSRGVPDPEIESCCIVS